MSITVGKIEDTIKRVAKSSAFSGNGILTFSVPIGRDHKDRVLELPGKHDPAAYLESLEGFDLQDKDADVAVVCAGNGGLAAELILNGFKSVECFEPRYLSEDGLKAATKVLSEFSEFELNTCLRSKFAWPTITDKKYDYILFPAGLDTTKSPMDQLELLLFLLKPNGVLFIEFALGSSTKVSGSMNSWRPTKKTFETTINSLGSFSVNHLMNGRLDNTIIYKISHELLVIADINDNIEESSPVVQLQDNSIDTPKSSTKAKAKTTKTVAPKAKEVKTDELSLEQKKAMLIEKGLFTEESIDEAIAAFGEGFLDEALQDKKEEPKKRPVKRKPTSRKTTTTRKRRSVKRKSK